MHAVSKDNRAALQRKPPVKETLSLKPAIGNAQQFSDLLERGYDRCAASYEQARDARIVPELIMLVGLLVPGAAALDIESEAGIPVARGLARRCEVTGVDISGMMV